MTNSKYSSAIINLKSLAVFNNITNDDVVKKFLNFYAIMESAEPTELSLGVVQCAYVDFVRELYDRDIIDFGFYVKELVFNDENAFVRAACRNHSEMKEFFKDAVKSDLNTISDILLSVSSEKIVDEIQAISKNYKLNLPQFKNSLCGQNICTEYFDRIENIHKFGFGIYAKYYVFHIEDKQIVPVKNPDPIRLKDLIDYEYQRNAIIENTLALIDGKPAANVLLTGDAGTGKSSSIKAVVNEYHDRGLRILEIKKEQLKDLGPLLGKLAENPLKFIVFIDDLSFEYDDDTFSACKAILEGSVLSKSDNVVLYATSNRRHLVKENFSDRDGDDIHRNDTIQQIVSLSERFGIHLSFSRPDKFTYLNIVHHLAKENGIEVTEDLDIKAEAFALNKANRSARCAKQFVNSLLAK